MKQEQRLKTVLFCLDNEWRTAAEKLADTLKQAQVRVSFWKKANTKELISRLLPQNRSEAPEDVRHIVVVTDSRALARRLGEGRIACVGCTDPEGKYFSGAGLVTDSPGSISAEELEEYLCHFQGWPVTVAVTERLILREMAKEDSEKLCQIGNQEGMQYLQEVLEENFFREDNFLAYIAQAYRLQGYGLWSVRKKDGTLIGCCGLAEVSAENGAVRLELQYMLDENFQQQGYGTEMCRAALRYAFARTSWDEIWLRIHPCNDRSRRLAQKLGFQYENTRAGLLHFRKKFYH